MTAGVGLVTFEAAEMAWIGFQPLQAVFAGLGLLAVVLAIRVRASRLRARHPTSFARPGASPPPSGRSSRPRRIR